MPECTGENGKRESLADEANVENGYQSGSDGAFSLLHTDARIPANGGGFTPVLRIAAIVFAFLMLMASIGAMSANASGAAADAGAAGPAVFAPG
jgi:hypothetical protein